jgi:Uma2 family endonuclease
MIAVTRRLFTLKEYEHLEEIGFFNPEERIELIRGELIKMAAKGRIHSVCNTLLVKEFYTLIADQAIIRVQDPIIILPNSAPEPDIVIARLKEDNYLSSHPLPEDILLLIEVSDSTLHSDQKFKLYLYAEAGITNYWIFNLVDNHLEVYTEPYQENENKFNYRSKRIYLPNEQIKIPEFNNVFLELSSIFTALS